MKRIVFLLAVLLAIQPLSAQTSHAAPTGDVSYAPLFLFTNGGGNIYAFQNGIMLADRQMLLVDSDYLLIAFPDRDCKFANWTPVDVITSIFSYTNSGSLATLTNTVVSPQPEHIMHPILKGQTQPYVAITQTSLLSIFAGQGWQANFVALRKTSTK